MNTIVFHIRCPNCNKKSSIKFYMSGDSHPAEFLAENSENMLTCPHCKFQDEMQKFPSPYAGEFAK